MGEALAARLRETTLAVYAAAARYARERGIIIADTKMEFGLLPGQRPGDAATAQRPGRRQGALLLIDELLTPDSSRFWEAATYEPGGAPPSYDKQYVRDYLETTGLEQGAPGAGAARRRSSPRPASRYVDALQRLTGSDALE